MVQKHRTILIVIIAAALVSTGSMGAALAVNARKSAVQDVQVHESDTITDGLHSLVSFAVRTFTGDVSTGDDSRPDKANDAEGEEGSDTEEKDDDSESDSAVYTQQPQNGSELVSSSGSGEPGAPNMTLSVSSQQIYEGQSTTLSWSSQNVTSCSASGGWSGVLATSGSQNVNPTVSTTYYMTCSGDGGSTGQSSITVAVTDPPPTGVTGDWTLVFEDEFSGSSLDQTKWSPCWFDPICGVMNNVSTSSSNVTVGDGVLGLTLSSSSTGALVSTDPSGGANPGFEYEYGVVEARIYFPGNGTECYNWPAFWSNGQNWPNDGENDIAESLGGEITVNYHSGSGAHNQGSVPGYWCGGYHTYTLHRQPSKSDVYYDGSLVKSYATDDGGAKQYIILNVGYNSSYPTVYGAASQVKVDYVRAWEQ